jgi:hypothetical protein
MLSLGLKSHAGLILGGGISSDPVSSAVASQKMASFYTSNSATSGTSVGLYFSHRVSGIGGGANGALLKGITNVAASLLVGAQIIGEFEAAGAVTGLAVGCRSELVFPDDATVAAGGTMAGGQSELYFNGDNSSTTDVSAAVTSIHRFIVDGDTTARAKVPYLFEIVNVSSGTSDATKILNTAHLTASHCLRIRVNGADYGLLLDAY